MTKVFLTCSFSMNFETYREGQELNLDDKLAAELIKNGWALLSTSKFAKPKSIAPQFSIEEREARVVPPDDMIDSEDVETPRRKRGG